jgi:hypothetical protein
MDGSRLRSINLKETRVARFGAFERRGFAGLALWIASVVGLMVAITFTLAQDSAPTPPPTAPGGEPSIYNFGATDRTCLSWSDGCRTCSYDKESSSAICSNVGIACQPREVTCVTRRPDTEKK